MGTPYQQVGHRLIDLTGAKAPAKGKDQRALVQPQLLARILLPGADDLLPHRIARQHAACFGVKMPLGICHRQHGPCRVPAQRLIGNARIRILLVDHGRDPHLDGIADHRPAHITSRSHTDVRLEFGNNLPRLMA